MEGENENQLTAADLAAAANSPDNNYVGDPVVPPKPGEDDNYAPLLFVEENAEENFIFYRHRQISRFEIPRATPENSMPVEAFKFTNHIAKVHKDDEQEFLLACSKLHGADRGNIVQIRNIQNEVALKRPEPQAFRGPASTQTIKAPTAAVAAQADEPRMPDGGPTATPSFMNALRQQKRI